MACQMCRERGKTWTGGKENDPQCAFEGDVFSTENWNCATAGAIRDLCDTRQGRLPEGVQTHCPEDLHYATISVYDMLEEPSEPSLVLAVIWYKQRGRTDAMWLLYDEGEPRRPTEGECRRILNVYAARAV